MFMQNDRAMVPNRSGKEDDPDEKVVVKNISAWGNGSVNVKFENGEICNVPEWTLLVDPDHQTCLKDDEHGPDHLVMLDLKPNVAVDPSVKDFPTALRKIVKLRLDQLALIFEAVSMYPSIGAAIDTLIRNIPKKDSNGQ